MPHLKSWLALAALSDLAKAIAAIDRATLPGFERHLGVLAALGAGGRVHLAGTPRSTGITALGPPRLPAGGAALGLIGEALRLEELLLSCGESEVRPAIGTL